jgi:hypothetical protein
VTFHLLQLVSPDLGDAQIHDDEDRSKGAMDGNVETLCPNGNSSNRQLSTPGRVVAFVFVMVGIGLIAGACGGGLAGVASVGSATSTSQAPSSAAAGIGGNTSKYRDALAYVNCMRLHGEPDFPDPAANGTLNVNFATGGKGGAPVSSGINRNSPQYFSADKTCRHFLPGGVPTPAQTQQALAKALKFSQCMRHHGVPNFPDPNPTNPGVVRLVGIDASSPQFQSALQTCEALVPGSSSK